MRLSFFAFIERKGLFYASTQRTKSTSLFPLDLVYPLVLSFYSFYAIIICFEIGPNFKKHRPLGLCTSLNGTESIFSVDKLFSPRPLVLLLSSSNELQVSHYVDRDAEESVCFAALPMVAKAPPFFSSTATPIRKEVSFPTASLTSSAPLKGFPSPVGKTILSKAPPSSTAGVNVARVGVNDLDVSVDFKRSVESFQQKIANISAKANSFLPSQTFLKHDESLAKMVQKLMLKTKQNDIDLMKLQSSTEEDLEEATICLASTHDVMRQCSESDLILEESPSTSMRKSYFSQYKILSSLPPALVTRKEVLTRRVQELQKQCQHLKLTLMERSKKKSALNSKENLLKVLKETSEKTRAIAQRLQVLEANLEMNGVKPSNSDSSSCVLLSNHKLSRTYRIAEENDRKWSMLLAAVRLRNIRRQSTHVDIAPLVLTSNRKKQWTHVKSLLSTSVSAVSSTVDDAITTVPLELAATRTADKAEEKAEVPTPPMPSAAPVFFGLTATKTSAKAEEKAKAPAPPIPSAAPVSFGLTTTKTAATKAENKAKAPAPPIPSAAPVSFGLAATRTPDAKAEDKAKAPVPPIPSAAPVSFGLTTTKTADTKMDEKAKAPAPPIPSAAPVSFGLAATTTAAKAEDKVKAPAPPIPSAAPVSFGLAATKTADTKAGQTVSVPVASTVIDAEGSKSSFPSLAPSLTKAENTSGAFSFSSFSSTIDKKEPSSAVATAASTWGATSSQKSLFSPKDSSPAQGFTSPPSQFGFAAAPVNGGLFSSPTSGGGGGIPVASTAQSRFGVAASTISKPSPFGGSPFSNPTTMSSSSGTSKSLFGTTSPGIPSSNTFGSSSSFASPATSNASALTIESKVREFYQRHNPSKMDEVPTLLEKYRGREAELIQKVYAFEHCLSRKLM